MTAENAIRFLHHEAAACRDRDACEALCLLMPALLRIFDLDPMEDIEANAFRYEFKLKLQELPFRDQTDRAAAAPPAVVQATESKNSRETAGHPEAHRESPAPAEAETGLEPAAAASAAS